MGNNFFGSKKNSKSEKKEQKCKHKNVLHKNIYRYINPFITSCVWAFANHFN